MKTWHALEARDVPHRSGPAGLALARVTIAAPKRRMDIALPSTAIIAELLPHLLRHSGEDLAEENEAHSGWVLRRTTGSLLEATRGLTVQGVRDGEVLYLVPRHLDWPEPAYDDVVDVIAGGARRASRSWGNDATRRCGLATAAAILVLGLAAVALSGPPWVVPAGVATVVAGALAIVGVLLARAFGDATAGAVVAASGMPYAFVGGVLLAAVAQRPGDQALVVGAHNLVLGSGMLVAYSVVCYTGVGATRWLFMAGGGVGLAGVAGATLDIMGVSREGSAAIILTIAIGMLPAYPLISGWLGRLPFPQLPERPEAILEDKPVPKRSDVFASVSRSSALLTGMLLAASTVSVYATAILVSSGLAPARLLAIGGACALLLRGRLFPSPVQRIPLLVGGVLGLVLVGFEWAVHAQVAGARVVLLATIVGTAWLILAAGLIYSRRPPSPYVGRIADILDVLAIMALVPLACAVLDVYSTVRGLFASIAG